MKHIFCLGLLLVFNLSVSAMQNTPGNIILANGDSPITANLRALYKGNIVKDYEEPFRLLVGWNSFLDHGIIPSIKEIEPYKKDPDFCKYKEYSRFETVPWHWMPEQQVPAYFRLFLIRRLKVEAAQRKLHPLKITN